MAKPNLGELLAEWLHEKARSLSEYHLFEGLIEAVESEDTEARYAGCKTRDERTIVRLAYELAEAKAEIETLRALAEIGELVQKMRDDSKLCKKDKLYWAEGVYEIPEHGPEYTGVVGCPGCFATQRTYDLVGTLRSIQVSEGTSARS